MRDTALTTLGNRIEWARRELTSREGREVSPAVLSFRMFCPEPTVGQWEQDIGKPCDEELELLAHLLAADPHWLVTGEPAPDMRARRSA
jgi:DNA-binding transcriptional regulator YiaG